VRRARRRSVSDRPACGLNLQAAQSPRNTARSREQQPGKHRDSDPDQNGDHVRPHAEAIGRREPWLRKATIVDDEKW
jgi:hypothetical protein